MPIIQKPFSLGRVAYCAISKKKQAPEQFKPFSIRINNKYSNLGHLKRFSKMFSEPESLVSYSFIASFQSVMQCLAQAPIPSGILGLIHIATSFQQHKAHNWRLPYDMEITIESVESSEKGLLYNASTKFYQLGELTIINDNRFLDKAKGYRPVKSDKNGQPQELGAATAHNEINGITALNYARTSGDFNPIHLGSIPAKLFGQKKAIIHGMYTVHWALLQLIEQDQGVDLSQIEVMFNKPCYIPAEIALYSLEENSYAVFNAKDKSQRHLLISTKKGA